VFYCILAGISDPPSNINNIENISLKVIEELKFEGYEEEIIKPIKQLLKDLLVFDPIKRISA
jgi:hypothetical protein